MRVAQGIVRAFGAAVLAVAFAGIAGIPGYRTCVFAGEDDPYAKGKTYAKVNGRPITGEDLAELIVRERWEDGLDTFVERELTAKAVAAAGIAVPNETLEARIQEVLELYGKERRRRYTLEELVQELNVYAREFREEVRRELCVFDLLKAKGLIAKEAKLGDKRAGEVMQSWLKELREKAKVVSDAKELGPDEALKIDGQAVSKQDFRTFVLRFCGPQKPETIEPSVGVLKEMWLVEEEMRRRNLTLEEQDLRDHMDFLGRRIQMETGASDPKRAVEILLASQKTAPDRFMRTPRFRLDAMITKLALPRLTDEFIQGEFRKNAAKYGEGDTRFGHLFVRVADKDGRTFRAKGEKTGLPTVDAAVEKQREEAFAAGKAKAEGLKAQAQGDWAMTVAKFSDDKVTCGNSGMWGDWVSERTPPRPPIDMNVLRAALGSPVGEVTGPHESSFGWHLVKVTEKRKVTFDQVKDLVRAGALDRCRKNVVGVLASKARFE